MWIVTDQFIVGTETEELGAVFVGPFRSKNRALALVDRLEASGVDEAAGVLQLLSLDQFKAATTPTHSPESEEDA
jgi:hypothetical protein